MKEILIKVLILLIFSAPAAMALPITSTYYSETSQGVDEMIVSNRSFSFPFVDNLNYGNFLSVPKFDPVLGQFLSARLVIDGYLGSAMGHHAWSPTGFVSSEAEAFVYSGFNVSSDLSTLLGTDRLTLSNTYSRQRLTDSAFIGPHVESERYLQNYYYFDESYSGADTAIFFQDPTSPYTETLGLSESGIWYSGMRGEHSGFPGTSFLDFPTEPQPGTKPGIGTLALTIARILNDGHNIAFSDMHMLYETEWSMSVSYTYEPVSAHPVPEPSTFLLLGAGLAGLGFVVRCRRKE